jgi:hypothetical protein
MVLVRAGEGPRAEARQGSAVEDIQVPAGEAVDIFYRYGFFSLSVRVVPRDDHGSWLIREPTTKVFTPNSLRQVKELREGKFEPQFQIFFCDDVEDLMKHYFHDFTAEGVVEPYRLYTGSWRTPTTVKYFGLSEETLHSDSGFVLVKLQRPRLTVRTAGTPQLMPEASKEFGRIRVGDIESVKTFTEDFGSHYIRSLTVGDTVYQVSEYYECVGSPNEIGLPWTAHDMSEVYVSKEKRKVCDSSETFPPDTSLQVMRRQHPGARLLPRLVQLEHIVPGRRRFNMDPGHPAHLL